MRRNLRTPVSPLVWQPGQSAGSEDQGCRWRPVLEQLWDRKLNEVIALTAACEGMSAAGEELPASDAIALDRGLHARAARSHAELGELVAALLRVDDGTYGRCEPCGWPMTDGWLARDPAARRCENCLTGGWGDQPGEPIHARNDRSRYRDS